MENNTSSTKSLFHYRYLTEDVADKVRTDEMLQELVQALVYTVADYDMSVTGKFVPSDGDREDTYWFFRAIVDRLGIPPQAIIDVIDECCPNDRRHNLTERHNSQLQASTN